MLLFWERLQWNSQRHSAVSFATQRKALRQPAFGVHRPAALNIQSESLQCKDFQILGKWKDIEISVPDR